MFNSPVLDLVILLTFMYFMGSLILSTINEAISGWFGWRRDQLEDSLQQLLYDGGIWKAFVDNTLIDSPHFQALMTADGRYPSYIPAQSFVSAIIGVIGAPNYTMANLVSGAPNVPASFQKILSDLAAQANGDQANFEKSLTDFYNSAMERSGGVYKRKVRNVLLIIGFILAAGMNLDTLQISRDALNNKQQLGQTVDKIVSQLPAIKNSNGTIDIKSCQGTISVATHPSPKDTANAAAKVNDNIKKTAELANYLQVNTGIAIGYDSWDDVCKKWFSSWGGFFLALAGILITTFALQLSSSFWFDLMNKVANMRATGKKPQSKTK